MDKIIVRLSRRRALFSLGVQFLTWSTVSHIDYIFDDGRPPYGARFIGGVDFELPDHAPSYEEYYEIKIPNKTELELFLLSQIKKPYDWRAIIGFPIRRDWQENDEWFCSELIAAGINRQMPLFNGRAGRITPEDFRRNGALKRINYESRR